MSAGSFSLRVSTRVSSKVSLFIMAIGIVVWCIAIPSLAAPQSDHSDEGLLGDLWHGRAHFQQIETISWHKPPPDSLNEYGGWIAVNKGIWYIFNRDWFLPIPSYCGAGPHWRVVVRDSTDQGRTWSDPAIVVATPDAGNPGDGCTIVDGSSYFDRDTNTWHMLTQCLDKHRVGGWMLCHYTRVGSSPMGLFTADPRNPVVRGGALWSRICGPGKACARSTRDEGTPDIVEKRNGFFYVTFHGWDYQGKLGFRGVAKTPNFREWIVSGPDLPDDAIVAASDCQKWNSDGCAGAGESTTLITGDYQYMLVEGPSISLACTNGQNWPFGLLRAPKDSFPRWGGGWQQFPGNPLLIPSWPGHRSRCALQYARWILDGNHVYLLYEDWGPAHSFRVIRLLKLVPGGGGPPVVLTSATNASH